MRIMTPPYIIALLVAALCSSCGVDVEKNDSSNHSARYSLFTWMAGEGDVCFVLVPYRQRDKFLHRWFPKRFGTCGIANLKNALKTLPRGSEVLWEELPPRGFVYPSVALLDDIQQFGKSENVDVVMAPILH
jgi:hypothetical protein